MATKTSSEEPCECTSESELDPTKNILHMTLEDESSCVSITATKIGPTFSESPGFEWTISQSRDVMPGDHVDSSVIPNVIITKLSVDSKTSKSKLDGSNVSSERNPPRNSQMRQKLSNIEDILKNVIKIKRGSGAKLPLRSPEIYRLPSGWSGICSTKSPQTASVLADSAMATRPVRQTQSREYKSCNCQRKNIHSIQTVRVKEENDSFVEKYSKIMFGLVLLYAILITVLGSFSLKSFFSIPDLENEIKALTDEVSKLENEVDKLSSEVHRLDEVVTRSEKNNYDLEIIVSDLSHENQLTHELFLQFNASNIELQDMSIKLVEENEDYEGYVMNLTQTVNDLTEETIFLNASSAILHATVEDFKIINMELQLQVAHFAEETQNLNMTVDKISDTLEQYKVENEYFNELNGNLSVIADFIMGETGIIQQSYEELVSYLKSIIMVKKSLARVGLKDRIQAEIAGLECGFLVAFGTEPFIQNVTLSIGASSYENVIDYVDVKLFKNLCIDVHNFQLFLRSEMLSPGLKIHEINMQDFIRGIDMYTSELIHYYFYDFGERKSMKDSDWEKANYECNNLVESKKFTFVAAN